MERSEKRQAYINMMISGLAHNLARYESGVVSICTADEYKQEIKACFHANGVKEKMGQKWMRRIEVQAEKELEILRNNEELLSDGGSSISASIFIESCLQLVEDVYAKRHV